MNYKHNYNEMTAAFNGIVQLKSSKQDAAQQRIWGFTLNFYFRQ